MPRRTPTYDETIRTWETLVLAVAGHSAETPFVQGGPVEQLQAYLSEIKDLVQVQDQATAERQAASRRIEELINLGKKLSTLVRIGLKNQYGYESEKLAAFSIQPLRRRSRVLRPQGPTPPEPEPEPTVPSSPVPPVETA
jgi:hypothetical protein